MKRNKILIVTLLLIALCSCEEYLDVNPNMGVSSEQVYSDYESFRGAVDLGYSLIYNPVEGASLNTQGYRPESYSDQAQCDDLSKPLGAAALGNFEWEIMDMGFNTGNAKNFSGRAVFAIRAENQAIANMHKLEEFPKETGYSEKELRDQLLGQAYFLRAWHYFEIIRRMGAMPRMDKVFNSDEDFDVVRPSYQQSTDWLVADLDTAIMLLPDSWNFQNKGRATKTTARAAKAMALLYAASPNMVHTDFTNGIFHDASTTDYNQDYLQRAIVASIDAIKSAEASSDYRMVSWEELPETWVSKTTQLSPECIFTPSFRSGPETNTNNGGSAWFKPPFDGGWSGATIYPSQNGVDMFETADGWDINDAPSGSYDPQDPYSKRDPRLRAWVYVNGDNMYLKPSAGHPNLESFVSYDGANGYHYDYMVIQKSQIWTGYVLKGKHRWEGNNNQDKIANIYRNFPYIRFSQLYLDLAEAANEIYGPNVKIPGADSEWETALKAVNLVRARSNMDGVRSEYTGDKDKFRERIRNERAIELYWEGHRWNDMKRWRIAKDKLKEIRAAEIIKTGNTLQYGSKVLNDVRIFDDKHYWFPFSKSVEDMFVNFKQNPGW